MQQPDFSGDCSSHLIIFTICIGILLGALILSPPERSAAHVQLGRIQLPSLCTFRALTGLPCPGCGLVRSSVAAVHGDVAASISFHRLGIPTLGYIFIRLLHSGVWLVAPFSRSLLARSERPLNVLLVVIAALYGLNWVVTLAEMRLA